MSKCACDLETVSGIYDPYGWCDLHRCRGCGHEPHSAVDGCPMPDMLTGWCECERGWISGRGPRQLIHKGGKP